MKLPNFLQSKKGLNDSERALPPSQSYHGPAPDSKHPVPATSPPQPPFQNVQAAQMATSPQPVQPVQPVTSRAATNVANPVQGQYYGTPQVQFAPGPQPVASHPATAPSNPAQFPHQGAPQVPTTAPAVTQPMAPHITTAAPSYAPAPARTEMASEPMAPIARGAPTVSPPAEVPAVKRKFFQRLKGVAAAVRMVDSGKDKAVQASEETQLETQLDRDRREREEQAAVDLRQQRFMNVIGGIEDEYVLTGEAAEREKEKDRFMEQIHGIKMTPEPEQPNPTKSTSQSSSQVGPSAQQAQQQMQNEQETASPYSNLALAPAVTGEGISAPPQADPNDSAPPEPKENANQMAQMLAGRAYGHGNVMSRNAHVGSDAQPLTQISPVGWMGIAKPMNTTQQVNLGYMYQHHYNAPLSIGSEGLDTNLVTQLGEGREKAMRAVEHDEAGNLTEAEKLYIEALSVLVPVSRELDNGPDSTRDVRMRQKNIVQRHATRLLDRCEEIRDRLKITDANPPQGKPYMPTSTPSKPPTEDAFKATQNMNPGQNVTMNIQVPPPPRSALDGSSDALLTRLAKRQDTIPGYVTPASTEPQFDLQPQAEVKWESVNASSSKTAAPSTAASEYVPASDAGPEMNQPQAVQSRPKYTDNSNECVHLNATTNPPYEGSQILPTFPTSFSKKEDASSAVPTNQNHSYQAPQPHDSAANSRSKQDISSAVPTNQKPSYQSLQSHGNAAEIQGTRDVSSVPVHQDRSYQARPPFDDATGGQGKDDVSPTVPIQQNRSYQAPQTHDSAVGSQERHDISSAPTYQNPSYQAFQPHTAGSTVGSQGQQDSSSAPTSQNRSPHAQPPHGKVAEPYAPHVTRMSSFGSSRSYHSDALSRNVSSSSALSGDIRRTSSTQTSGIDNSLSRQPSVSSTSSTEHSNSFRTLHPAERTTSGGANNNTAPNRSSTANKPANVPPTATQTQNSSSSNAPPQRHEAVNSRATDPPRHKTNRYVETAGTDVKFNPALGRNPAQGTLQRRKSVQGPSPIPRDIPVTNIHSALRKADLEIDFCNSVRERDQSRNTASARPGSGRTPMAKIHSAPKKADMESTHHVGTREVGQNQNAVTDRSNLEATRTDPNASRKSAEETTCAEMTYADHRQHTAPGHPAMGIGAPTAHIQSVPRINVQTVPRVDESGADQNQTSIISQSPVTSDRTPKTRRSRDMDELISRTFPSPPTLPKTSEMDPEEVIAPLAQTREQASKTNSTQRIQSPVRPMKEEQRLAPRLPEKMPSDLSPNDTGPGPVLERSSESNRDINMRNPNMSVSMAGFRSLGEQVMDEFEIDPQTLDSEITSLGDSEPPC